MSSIAPPPPPVRPPPYRFALPQRRVDADADVLRGGLDVVELAHHAGDDVGGHDGRGGEVDHAQVRAARELVLTRHWLEGGLGVNIWLGHTG